jgi:hypothetical protein
MEAAVGTASRKGADPGFHGHRSRANAGGCRIEVRVHRYTALRCGLDSEEASFRQWGRWGSGVVEEHLPIARIRHRELCVGQSKPPSVGVEARRGRSALPGEERCARKTEGEEDILALLPVWTAVDQPSQKRRRKRAFNVELQGYKRVARAPPMAPPPRGAGGLGARSRPCHRRCADRAGAPGAPGQRG